MELGSGELGGVSTAELCQQRFLRWGRGLFLGAVPLCLDLSAPMCFLLCRPEAGASPSFPHCLNAFLA